MGQVPARQEAGVLPLIRPSARRQLLEMLERCCREELVAAERMSADAGGVRADYLRRKLEGIAAAEREHAQALGEAIARLGGAPPGPMPPLGPRPGRSFLRLADDLEEVKRVSAVYLEGAAMARRAGADEVAVLLARIREDEERHVRELVDVLARVDPNA